MNCTIKLLTKLLANKLQAIILDLIHINQYGFIKSRTIQGCIAWAYEYLFHCHISKKPTVVLKLDFAKAFDKIEHGMILENLKQKGFGILKMHELTKELSRSSRPPKGEGSL